MAAPVHDHASPDLQACGANFRPLRPEDASALSDLLVTVRAADGLQEPNSREELRHLWLDHPGTRLETDSLAALATDGSLVGATVVHVRDEPAEVARAFLPGAVLPGLRRRGIGTHLLRWAEQRAGELLDGSRSGLKREIACEAATGATKRISLLEAHGFQRVRSFVAMRRDLTAGIPAPELPTGLTFEAWRPDLDDATRLAHNDAFRDHWGSEPLSPERWRHFVAEAPGFRPDCSWLAVHGETVAGYTLATLNEDPVAGRFGWLGTIGVRRAWRNHGVATALIARSLASFADAGVRTAGLHVDADNPTGAVRVYGSLGFRPGDESIIFAKPV